MHRATIAITASAVLATTGSAGVTYRTIALTGQQAPGCDEGVTFASFTEQPKLNNSGRVAFRAYLAGPGVTSANSSAIWSDRTGALAMEIRSGSDAPGLDPGIALNVGIPVLTDSGRIGFGGWLSGDGITNNNRWTIVTDATGEFAIIVRSGEPAPGTPEGTVLAPRGSADDKFIVFNADADCAFKWDIVGSGITTANDTCVWAHQGGSLRLVAREEQRPAGTPEGVFYRSFSFDPQINDSGRIAFEASLKGAVTSADDHGIWIDDWGVQSPFSKGGDPAPLGIPGATFTGPFSPRLNGAGDICFRSYLKGSGINVNNDASLWVSESGVLRLLAREGDQIPGLSAGVRYTTGLWAELNDAGTIAMKIAPSAGNQSIWKDEGGTRTQLFTAG